MPMNPVLKSVYLGDRACKAVLIDSWRKRVAIQVDVISRLQPGAKTWDFYTDEDIKDGWLVFTGIRSVRLEPAGPLPNDLINQVSVRPTAGDSDRQLLLRRPERVGPVARVDCVLRDHDALGWSVKPGRYRASSHMQRSRAGPHSATL